MKIALLLMMTLAMVGCRSQSQSTPVVKVVVEERKRVVPPQSRKRSAEQMQLLSDFAQKESPKIWHTIQLMRGEIAECSRRLKKLREELVEFERNPDADEDYKSLQAGLFELKRACDAIYDCLEDAYIAAKKFEATPSRKSYQDMMTKVLEDGLSNAEITIDRYRLISGR